MAKERGDLGFRLCRAEDIEEIAPIVYNAFAHFALSVGIPPQHWDFPTLESASHVLHGFFAPNSNSLGFIAFLTSSCKPVGGAFLHHSGGGVHSIGPVFVDPYFSNNGAGKAIMQFLLHHAKENKASSVRLLQDCSNMKCFSLYAKVGFQPVECLSVFEGSVEPNVVMDACSTLEIKPINDILAREMREDDVNLCADLFKRTMGYERSLELRAQLLSCAESAWVAERNGDLMHTHRDLICLDTQLQQVKKHLWLCLSLFHNTWARKHLKSTFQGVFVHDWFNGLSQPNSDL